MQVLLPDPRVKEKCVGYECNNKLPHNNYELRGNYCPYCISKALRNMKSIYHKKMIEALRSYSVDNHGV